MEDRISTYVLSPVDNNSASLCEQTKPSTIRNRKRERSNSECAEHDALGAKRRRRRRIEPQADSHMLACPFAKHDPLQATACWNFATESVARTKEHLRRQHKRPPYCPRCIAEFANDEDMSAHRCEDRCNVVARPPRGVWLSETAKSKIEERTPRCQSAGKAWTQLYMMLFPGELVPSPYVEDFSKLSLQRTRKHVARDLIRHVRSRIEPSPTSQMATALNCLMKIVEEYNTQDSDTDMPSAPDVTRHSESECTASPPSLHPSKSELSALCLNTSEGSEGTDATTSTAPNWGLPYYYTAGPLSFTKAFTQLATKARCNYCCGVEKSSQCIGTSSVASCRPKHESAFRVHRPMGPSELCICFTQGIAQHSVGCRYASTTATDLDLLCLDKSAPKAESSTIPYWLLEGEIDSLYEFDPCNLIERAQLDEDLARLGKDEGGCGFEVGGGEIWGVGDGCVEQKPVGHELDVFADGDASGGC